MAKPDIPGARWMGPPRSYTEGRKNGQPTVIFIHTTEGSERPTSAEDGAEYDKRRTDGTSAHLFVDQNSIVQCVEFEDEAHTARSHGNDVGIHIEVCGKAGQSKTQWADPASSGTLTQLARACAAIRKRYGKSRFPLVNLTPAQLKAGYKGFAEHYDATRAWPSDGGTHTDPGPNFPWSKLFADIAAIEKAEQEKVMAFDEKFKIGATLGRELFEPDLPAGTERSAAEILSLAAIWAKRAADKEDRNAAELVALKGQVAKLQATLDAILTAVQDPGPPPGDGTTRPAVAGG